MSALTCGLSIRNGANPPGAGGCLVNFADAPQRVLLLTAAHVVVPSDAKQNDPVFAASIADRPIGRLRTWSDLSGATTVDAALVWIDPSMVTPEVGGLGIPAGINTEPQLDDELQLFPLGGIGTPRKTKIKKLDATITMRAWGNSIDYQGQILCDPSISQPGDSGAMVFDSNKNIVGMLVGGATSIGDVITPIGAILNHTSWKGVATLVTQMPASATAPDTETLPYADLGPAYERLFAAAQIDATHQDEVEWYRKKVVSGRPDYERVVAQTTVPWWFVGIVHGLECSFNFSTHLHNGDPLSARTVHVPIGRPMTWNPPTDWVSSAGDAIVYQQLTMQGDWSLARSLYRLEGYNGYGYYAKGINSPYLWSFSNLYTRGKFIADGEYDPDAVSKQCGGAVMLKALMQAGDVVL
jgi:lysozyme family protein